MEKVTLAVLAPLYLLIHCDRQSQSEMFLFIHERVCTTHLKCTSNQFLSFVPLTFVFWIFTNIFPKIEMLWHCESWSAKRCPWYCILIQLESKRNANCIFFCTIYPRDICVQKYFCCGTVCISLDANVVLPGLLVAPFFSSLAPPRGKYFSLLQESNSARYANRTMLPEEILSICHQLWIKMP